MGNATRAVWERLDGEARGLVVATATRWGCEPAALLAVIEIESAGRIFARVDGRDEPLIRFEGHWFDRLLAPKRRKVARRAGLAHPAAGRVANPRSQAGRWRLLARAVEIDRRAALSSCSWGLGQVMGFHWQRLGYGSVDAMVAQARSGSAGQIRLLVAFADKEKLASALASRDWHRFARRYNGPAYAKHGYHTRLAAAYARGRKLPLVVPSLPEAVAEPATGEGGLRFGARGPQVRKLQAALSKAGHPLVVDGLFGIRTDKALREWQRRRGAAVTGAVSLGDAWHLFGARRVLAIVIERLRGTLSSPRADA